MLIPSRRKLTFGAAALALALSFGPAFADKTLLNVSYDPTREFYKEFNEAFAADWKAKTGESSPSTSRTAARASRPAR